MEDIYYESSTQFPDVSFKQKYFNLLYVFFHH